MTTQTDPNFRYWNSVDPQTFLDHDWQNPSRVWATEQAIAAAKRGNGSLLEIGPGPGVDYDRYFRDAVLLDQIQYKAYEGSENLCNALRLRFPESSWHWAKISDLGPEMSDVVYARHVLEHQPALEPALGLLLGAARRTVVLTWYRPPADTAFGEVWEGVPCQTYERVAVADRIAAAGFSVVAWESFASGDETWILERGAGHVTAISDARWAAAQAGEHQFWVSTDRRNLARKLDALYAEQLGIHAAMADGLTVLDIGGGPMPIGALFQLPLKAYTVVDPLPHVRTRVQTSLNMLRVQMAAEEYQGGLHDEAWGYNVLQHVIDPGAVLATAKRHSKRVRWFDWVDTPVETHHPHSLTADWIAAQFADWRIVSDKRGTAQVGRTQRYIALVAERPMTVGELLQLTAEELDWCERSKTGDLAPSQFLRVSELQTRGYLLTHMAAGPEREALEQECLALKADLAAMPVDATMKALNEIGQRHMELHRRVVMAAKERPKLP